MAKKKQIITDRKDIKFDGSTALWTINEVGTINGSYIGTFKFRTIMMPTQKIAANREYRELLGANAALAGESESFLAYALTQLKYRIIEAPPFWYGEEGDVGGDLPDENVISKVLEAAVDAEVMYRQEKDKQKLEAIQRAKEAAERVLKQNEVKNESKSKEDSD